MKVIVLNYGGCYVEVSDVPMELEKKLNDGELCDAEVMMRLGYDINDTHWMFSEDNEFPVFWKNEVIPYMTL